MDFVTKVPIATIVYIPMKSFHIFFTMKYTFQYWMHRYSTQRCNGTTGTGQYPASEYKCRSLFKTRFQTPSWFLGRIDCTKIFTYLLAYHFSYWNSMSRNGIFAFENPIATYGNESYVRHFSYALLLSLWASMINVLYLKLCQIFPQFLLLILSGNIIRQVRFLTVFNHAGSAVSAPSLLCQQPYRNCNTVTE